MMEHPTVELYTHFVYSSGNNALQSWECADCGMELCPKYQKPL